jgi:nucleotide-binding universal stress UspA family protein
MFDHVIAAYDGSDHSEDALALARVLTSRAGRITAACAYWIDARSARVGVQRRGESGLRVDTDDLLARLREREHETLDVLAIRGPTPASALHSLLETGDYDLAVVGSSRRSTLGRVLSGTTAAMLLHGSPCAVAVAPAGYRDVTATKPLRVGVGYDGSPTATAALDTARLLVEEHGASLVVLDAIDRISAYATSGAGGSGREGLPPDVALQTAAQVELDDALSRCRGLADVRGELLGGRPVDALLARAGDLDLLVVGSRGYGRVRGVVLGSMSRRLAEHAPCPLLIVPQPALEP